MTRYRRKPEIVEAEPVLAVDFLSEHPKATIDGKRLVDYRTGFKVVAADGSVSWCEREKFLQQHDEMEK